MERDDPERGEREAAQSEAQGAATRIGGGERGNPRFLIAEEPDLESPLASAFPEIRRAREAQRSAAGAERLAALPVRIGAPPHPRIESLIQVGIPGTIAPIGRAAAHGTEWLVCRPPPTPPAFALGLYRGDAFGLTHGLVRSVAATLCRLEAAELTHRAIRPENLFEVDKRALLGPFWHAPPASTQSAVFEPPWSASCAPEARGAGSIADDVYALGVTLLTLFLGEIPLACRPSAEIVERKLWFGSAPVLLEGRSVPLAFGELIAAMVADDPAQRPHAQRLESSGGLIGVGANTRRRINAALPLAIGARDIWTVPEFVWTIAEDPSACFHALVQGQVDAWLRRGLNEIVLAERLDGFVRAEGHARAGRLGGSAESLFLCRAAQILDPGAPLVWGGFRLFRDALRYVVAACAVEAPPYRQRLRDLLESGVLQVGAGSERQRSWSAFTLARLAYDLNPGMACNAPALRGKGVVAIEELLPSLDAAFAAGDAPSREGMVIDTETAGFFASRQRTSILLVVPHDDAAELKLLAMLAAELRQRALPHLARRLAGPAMRVLDAWPSSSGREARRRELDTVVARGDLVELNRLAGDVDGLERARAARSRAHDRVRALRARRAALLAERDARRATARRFGSEAASILGVAGAALVLLARALA